METTPEKVTEDKIETEIVVSKKEIKGENEDNEDGKKLDQEVKQESMPTFKYQFRMKSSDGHKTLQYRYSEEVEHTIVMKNGVTCYESKQFDHNPIINGKIVSPDVRTVTCTKLIGENKYQTTELTTDGTKEQKQLTELSDADVEMFKNDWESNWKPSIDEKQMNENMASAMQQVRESYDE